MTMSLTMKNERQFRLMPKFEIRAAGEEGNELYVEGYAATFNTPTVLLEYGGVQYKEQIDSKAFDGADMSDVIFQYDHMGKVMARTRNKTLQVAIDATGLHVRARLDGTEAGRQLYDEIRQGYVDRMSFAFTVREDSYDREAHTRTILAVRKLYDVSAVSIPIYESTTIAARSYFEAQLEVEKQRRERLRRVLLLSQL